MGGSGRLQYCRVPSVIQLGLDVDTLGTHSTALASLEMGLGVTVGHCRDCRDSMGDTDYDQLPVLNVALEVGVVVLGLDLLLLLEELPALEGEHTLHYTAVGGGLLELLAQVELPHGGLERRAGGHLPVVTVHLDVQHRLQCGRHLACKKR